MNTNNTTGGQNIEAIYPLSPMQQGLLYQTLYSNSKEYFQQLSYTIEGDLNAVALRRAWERVVERHTILRTLFVWERHEKPLQVVRKKVKLPWVEYDWQGVPEHEQQERLDALLEADRRRGFELSKAPLMRLALIHLAEKVYQFAWSYHHLLLDGWSGNSVRNEVFAFYDAFSKGRDVTFNEPRPFRDYIAWLQKQDVSKAEAFWRETLKGFEGGPRLESNHAAAKRPSQNAAASECDSWGGRLSESTTDALQAIARQHRLTLNVLVQGAWGLLLSHLTGRADVVFGSVVSGRPAQLEGIDSMVGVFINTLPVRIRIDEEVSLIPWLKQIQAAQAASARYEYTPLVDIQGWSDVPRGTPLFESILVFQSFPQENNSNGEASTLQMYNPRVVIRNNYPLTLRAIPGSGLLFQMLYEPPRFEMTAVARMMAQLEALMRTMVERPDAKLKTLVETLQNVDEMHRTAKEQEFRDSRLQKLRGLKRKEMVS